MLENARVESHQRKDSSFGKITRILFIRGLRKVLLSYYSNTYTHLHHRPIYSFFLPLRVSWPPDRSIKRHAHNDPRHQPRARHSKHPADKDLANLLPVDRLKVVVRQRHPDNSARNTLRRRHRQTQVRSQQDRNCRSQLHRIPTRRRVLGNAVPEVAHDMVSERPEPEPQTQPTDGFNPRRRLRLRRRHASRPRLVLGGEGPDGVGDVVGPVRDRHDHRRAHLRRRPKVLDFIVELGCAAVYVLESLGLVSDYVPRDAVEEHHADRGPDAARVGPGEGIDGF